MKSQELNINCYLMWMFLYARFISHIQYKPQILIIWISFASLPAIFGKSGVLLNHFSIFLGTETLLIWLSVHRMIPLGLPLHVDTSSNCRSNKLDFPRWYIHVVWLPCKTCEIHQHLNTKFRCRFWNGCYQLLAACIPPQNPKFWPEKVCWDQTKGRGNVFLRFRLQLSLAPSSMAK